MHARRVALLLVAACGAPSTSSDAGEETDRQIEPVRHGSHGSVIDIIAATANGTAAVTQDATGNTRLWPALDGTVEPIVVRASAASELALVHDENFMIGSLDEAGDLELVIVTADGVERARKQVLRDGSVISIAAVSRWLLALRNDQTIEVIGVTGDRGRIALPSGDRGVALAARNDHVVVIASTGTGAHAIPIEPAALTLGSASPAFTIEGRSFALSPDGKKLGVMGRADLVYAIDLAVGGEGQRTCQEDVNPSDGFFPSRVAQQVPIGFIDDTTISCLTFGMVKWFSLAKSGAPVYSYAAAHPELIAYGGDVQLSGHGVAMGIAHRQGSMQYLGYRVPEAVLLRASPRGVVVEKPGAAPLVLDRALTATTRIGIDPRDYEDAVSIDERYALRTVARTDGHEIILADTQTGEEHQVATSDDYHLKFEPATNLLAVQPDRIAHYDPDSHAFDRSFTKLPASGDIYLVDPALAHAVIAVVVAPSGGHYHVVEVGRDLAVQTSYEVDGHVVHVDRAGRVYVATGSSVQVYAANKRVAELPTTAVTVATDPEATHAVVIGGDRITMFDGAVRRWSVPAQTAISAVWDHGPVIRYASGLARLDLRTGRVRERGCGWVFELRVSPPELTGATESVCDAE